MLAIKYKKTHWTKREAQEFLYIYIYNSDPFLLIGAIRTAVVTAAAILIKAVKLVFISHMSYVIWSIEL